MTLDLMPKQAILAVAVGWNALQQDRGADHKSTPHWARGRLEQELRIVMRSYKSHTNNGVDGGGPLTGERLLPSRRDYQPVILAWKQREV